MIVEIIILFIISFFIKKTYLDKGKLGERSVAKKLKKLDKHKYKVINDVILKTSRGTSQIDHLVVSNYGIFVIETKNYQGWIVGSENTDNWQQIIYNKKNYFRNPIKQNYSHIKAIEENLKLNNKIKYISIIVFMNGCDLKVNTTTPVLYEHDLLKQIYKYKKQLLSEEEVKNTYKMLLKANKNSMYMRWKHSINVKNNMKKQKPGIMVI